MMPYNREKDSFDDYSIEIGRRIFNLQILISGFTAELLKTFSDEKAPLDAEAAIQVDGTYEVKNIKSIYYDEKSDSIMISCDDGYSSCIGDLDVSTQQLIFDSLLMKYRSDKIFSSLSGNRSNH